MGLQLLDLDVQHSIAIHNCHLVSISALSDQQIVRLCEIDVMKLLFLLEGDLILLEADVNGVVNSNTQLYEAKGNAYRSYLETCFKVEIG